MKFVFSSIKSIRPNFPSFFSTAVFFLLLTLVCQTGQAQQTQLSLADILIGLRSKKATLPEKNKLLAEAVKARGITFTLTPEIEVELQTTGADIELVQAIKEKVVKIKPVSMIKPETVPVSNPAATSTPAPDFAFYRKRADESIIKGEYDSAVGDYNKALELNPKDALAYLNRGRAYHNKTSYDLAIVDFSKAIEINPKDLSAYLSRGDTFEKKGNLQKALDDYQKAVELDANNESAKNNLKRLQNEQAKAEQLKNEQSKFEQAKTEQAKTESVKTEPAKNLPKPNEPQKTAAISTPTTPITTPNTDAPQTVELGQLNSLAVKLAVPAYPPFAQKMNMQGKITVQVALDEEGKVVSAKAVNGQSLLRNAAEDAIRNSRFKPTIINNRAVKATGFIVYNFVAPK